MKIAVIAPTHIPAQRANTLQVMKMTQALAGLGHAVRLIVPGSPLAGEESCQWDHLARQYGLQDAFPVEWLPAAPRLRRYDFSWQAVRRARQWGAELVYTRLPQAATMASILGMPVVLETHDLPQGRVGPWMFRLFLRGSGAKRLVVITHTLAVDMAQKLGAPDSPPFTIVAPDGVDLRRYADLPNPAQARQALNQVREAGASIIPEGFLAGYTGHFYPGRGEELLLALAERLPDVNFLLAGGEPEDVARLQTKAKHLNNVILPGFIPNVDLPLYQAACDALLMPYQRQVAASSGGDIARYLSPMKLFEYLACGRPILCSDLAVLREILDAENAMLLPPDQPEAWATALEDLQAMPERSERLAANARRTAFQHTWERRATQILDGIQGRETATPSS
jgi:glycosyltransferase involved in cell wall biosynthesis